MYKLIRPLLFSQDSEKIHYIVAKIGEWFGKYAFTHLVLQLLYKYNNPFLENTICGLHFNNPVGLAAGFDKKGQLINILDAVGFSHIEVGTVTPKAQPGNPQPRLFRLMEDEALINRMGFNSEGLDQLIKNLKIKHIKLIIGGNIGKNKVTPNEQAIEDYVQCFEALYNYVDYFTVNVSSPNTPGLRELQDKAPLTTLLNHLQQQNSQKAKRKPIFLKIAPDMTQSQLDDIAEVIKATQLDGVIATNTTISRDNLVTNPEVVQNYGEGGLSGKPLKNKSTEVIKYLYQQSQGSFIIIGAGGIFTAKDAYEKIKAGASLVQVYTGMIYEGPGIVKKINQGLVSLLAKDGYTTIADAVGKG